MDRTKFNKIHIIQWLLIPLLIALTSSLMISPAASAQQPTIYMVPSDNFYNINTTPVGTKFNVTVLCANVTQDIGGAQITLYFDDSIINVTRWFTVPESEGGFMPEPITALPAPPNNTGYIHVGSGEAYVKISVMKGGLPPTAPWGHNGTIAIFEFNITAPPPEGGQLTCPLSINNIDTYLLDPSAEEIPSVIKEDGTYTIIPEFTLITMLVLFTTLTVTVAVLRKKGILKKHN